MDPVASQHSFDETQLFCRVSQNLPWTDPTCLFISYNSSPCLHAPARLALLTYALFLSFLWAFSLYVPSAWNSVPADLCVGGFSSLRALPKCHFFREIIRGSRALADINTSCHTLIHIAQFLCFHRCFDSLKLLVYYVYYLHCLLVTFTCL